MPQAANKTKKFNIRTTEHEYAEVQMIARFEGKTVSDFVTDAIRDKVEYWEDLQAVRRYEASVAEGSVSYLTLEEIVREHELDL
jgi:uncharacterized protein (DUF1778 family)